MTKVLAIGSVALRRINSRLRGDPDLQKCALDLETFAPLVSSLGAGPKPGGVVVSANGGNSLVRFGTFELDLRAG
jgi:hypothetical protein